MVTFCLECLSGRSLGVLYVSVRGIYLALAFAGAFFSFFSLFCLDIKLISLPLSYPKRGVCDSSSVGRALASQAKGHGFESRLSLIGWM